MIFADIVPFIGRFHPVLVHLPIGILIAAILLDVISLKNRYESLRTAVQPLLFLGAVSAVFSCITGYMLSLEGGYPDDLLQTHQWMGIAVAVVSSALFLAHNRRLISHPKFSVIVSIVLFIGITITGHLGGSLTHGEEYLTENSPFNKAKTDSVFMPKPISDISKAVAYTDVVEPILHQKCYSCHSASKQKGALRMDEFSLLMKGGKHGEIIKPKNAAESELLIRAALPLDDDKHMPPTGKPQLSKEEVALLHNWIEKGADEKQKVDTSVEVKKLIMVWQANLHPPKPKPIIPGKEVAMPDAQAIKNLQAKNVVILPAGKNSNYLSLNFINAPQNFASALPDLEKLKQQIIWLKIGSTDVNDEHLQLISTFPNLMRLNLEHTAVTDKGVAMLEKLKGLEYLNLVGTKVNGEGLLKLKGLKKLKEVYLYKTGVTHQKFAALKQQFKGVLLDTGGYQLPFLAADTAVLKKAK